MTNKNIERINWNDLSRLGLVFRINNEILHPLGLAVFYEPESGVSAGALVSDDGTWSYSADIINSMQTRGPVTGAKDCYELVQSEISDFFSGLGSPGSPEEPAEMQRQLQQRIAVVCGRLQSGDRHE